MSLKWIEQLFCLPVQPAKIGLGEGHNDTVLLPQISISSGPFRKNYGRNPIAFKPSKYREHGMVLK